MNLLEGADGPIGRGLLFDRPMAGKPPTRVTSATWGQQQGSLQFNNCCLGGKTAFVPAWMESFNKQVNVVLVDWKNLAFFGQVKNLKKF